jgi:hypothetical protein
MAPNDQAPYEWGHYVEFARNAASARRRKTLGRPPLSLADHELLRPEIWRWCPRPSGPARIWELAGLQRRQDLGRHGVHQLGDQAAERVDGDVGQIAQAQVAE